MLMSYYQNTTHDHRHRTGVHGWAVIPQIQQKRMGDVNGFEMAVMQQLVENLVVSGQSYRHTGPSVG